MLVLIRQGSDISLSWKETLKRLHYLSVLNFFREFLRIHFEKVEHFQDKQENERERRESLANHQEKGDFFYLLDPMVRKPASVLTAIMSDLVQDLELAKKMCKTSQLGPVTSR